MTPEQLQQNSWARALNGNAKGGCKGGKACQSWTRNEDAQIILLIAARLQLEDPQLTTAVSPSTPLTKMRTFKFTLRLGESKKKEAILTRQFSLSDQMRGETRYVGAKSEFSVRQMESIFKAGAEAQRQWMDDGNKGYVSLGADIILTLLEQSLSDEAPMDVDVVE